LVDQILRGVGLGKKRKPGYIICSVEVNTNSKKGRVSLILKVGGGSTRRFCEKGKKLKGSCKGRLGDKGVYIVKRYLRVERQAHIKPGNFVRNPKRGEKLGPRHV